MSRLGLAWLLLLVAACPDPQGRFDEFGRRVVDARPSPDAPDLPDARPLDVVPDVSGRFLLALAPVIAPTAPFQFIATNTNFVAGASGGATFDMELHELHTTSRTLVGAPDVITLPVNDAGQFDVTLEGIVVDGLANPISGSTLTANFTFRGTIRSEDRFCGDILGRMVSPYEVILDGSTFSAIRVADEAFGDALPAPELACPVEVPDGGLPDAPAPADASPADASPADASPADASPADAAPDAT